MCVYNCVHTDHSSSDIVLNLYIVRRASLEVSTSQKRHMLHVLGAMPSVHVRIGHGYNHANGRLSTSNAAVSVRSRGTGT